MNIEAINVQNTAEFQMRKTSDQASESRKQKDSQVQSEQIEKNRVQPEELLQQIKALTKDGLYSVRFEADERTDDLVIKIVDRDNDELIRQLPAEELLKLREVLEDLRGNIIKTEG